MSVAVQVLIDFDNDGIVDPQQRTPRLLGATAVQQAQDVSARVRQSPPLVCSYGRDAAREYQPPAAGKCTFDLDNTDGLFASLNSASALFGRLNPGLLCRVRRSADGGATWSYVHSGYTDVPSEQPGIRQQRVALTSFDGLAALKAAVISTAELVGVTIDVAVSACLDAAGWPASLRDIATADTTLNRWCVDRLDAFTALRDLTYSEGPPATFYVDPDTMKFHWENRTYRLTQARATTSQMTVRSQGAEPVFGQELGFDPGVASVVNSCTVPVNAYTIPGSVGVVWTGPTPLALVPAQVYTIEVSTSADWFTGALAPVAATDYTLTGTALASATLSRTSGKRATLTLTAGAGSCTITGLQVRAKTVTVAKTYYANTISGASASGVDYRTRTFPTDFIPSWLPNANTAIDFCNYVVGRYKDPVPTVRFVLNNETDARFAFALPRKPSDRITVIEPLRAFLNGAFFVEQLTDVIASGGSGQQRVFACEQASSLAYGVWDTSVWSNDAGTTVGKGLWTY